MYLSQAITKAKSIDDFNTIFENNVVIQLGWVNDKVTVQGYQGTVTTDLIAQCVLKVSSSETKDSKKLATLLAMKVFTPLKNLVEAPENQCVPYQIAALTRIGWTPRPASEFGRSIALKHAMVLGLLDIKYANW